MRLAALNFSLLVAAASAEPLVQDLEARDYKGIGCNKDDNGSQIGVSPELMEAGLRKLKNCMYSTLNLP